MAAGGSRVLFLRAKALLEHASRASDQFMAGALDVSEQLTAGARDVRRRLASTAAEQQAASIAASESVAANAADAASQKLLYTVVIIVAIIVVCSGACCVFGFRMYKKKKAEVGEGSGRGGMAMAGEDDESAALRKELERKIEVNGSSVTVAVADQEAPTKSIFESANRMTIVSEGITYGVFILLFSISVSVGRTTVAYRMTQIVEEVFVAEEMTRYGDGLLNVATYTDLWNWAEGRLVDGVFATTYKKCDNCTERVPGIIDGSSRVIGQVQLRMQRVKPGGCTFDDAFVPAWQQGKTALLANVQCHPEYNEVTAHTDKGQSGSQTQFGSYTARAAVCNATERVCNGTNTLDGLSNCPFPDVPSGGTCDYLYRSTPNDGIFSGSKYQQGGIEGVGFNTLLPIDNAAAFRKRLFAVRKSFHDFQSRAMSIDLVLYNANVDTWCAARFVFEFPAAGGVVPSYEIAVARLTSGISLENITHAIIDVVIFMFVLYYSFVEIQELFGMRYECEQLLKIYYKHLEYKDAHGSLVTFHEQWTRAQLRQGINSPAVKRDLDRSYTRGDVAYIKDSCAKDIFSKNELELPSYIPVFGGSKYSFSITPTWFRMYCDEGWNVIDWTNLIFFYCSFYFRYLALFAEDDLIKKTANREYVQHHSLPLFLYVEEVRMMDICNAINVWLMWFRLFKYTSVNPRFGQLIKTLSFAKGSIFYFMFIFMICNTGLSFFAWMAYGSNVYAFRTIGQTMVMLIRGLTEGAFTKPSGDDASYLNEMYRFQPTVTVIFYVAYTLLFVFVLMNMFISLIMYAYEKVDADIRDEPLDDLAAEIVSSIIQRLESVFGRFINPAGHSSRPGAMRRDEAEGKCAPFIKVGKFFFGVLTSNALGPIVDSVFPPPPLQDEERDVPEIFELLQMKSNMMTDDEPMIDAKTLFEEFKTQGIFMLMGQCHKMMEKYDEDGENGLDLEEFRALITQDRNGKKLANRLMLLVKRNRVIKELEQGGGLNMVDNLLDINELKLLVKRVLMVDDVQATRFAAEAMDYCDADGSGRLDADETEEAMRYINTLWGASDLAYAVLVRMTEAEKTVAEIKGALKSSRAEIAAISLKSESQVKKFDLLAAKFMDKSSLGGIAE